MNLTHKFRLCHPFLSTQTGDRAICNGHLESFKDLLKIFKNLNFLFDSGESLIHIATTYRQYSISKFLVENGANVNILNNCHNPPITYSIRHNDLKTTQLLIDYGADIYKLNFINLSPYSIAENKNNKEIIQIFEKYTNYKDLFFQTSVTTINQPILNKRIKI